MLALLGCRLGLGGRSRLEVADSAVCRLPGAPVQEAAERLGPEGSVEQAGTVAALGDLEGRAAAAPGGEEVRVRARSGFSAQGTPFKVAIFRPGSTSRFRYASPASVTRSSANATIARRATQYPARTRAP